MRALLVVAAMGLVLGCGAERRSGTSPAPTTAVIYGGGGESTGLITVPVPAVDGGQGGCGGEPGLGGTGGGVAELDAGDAATEAGSGGAGSGGAGGAPADAGAGGAAVDSGAELDAGDPGQVADAGPCDGLPTAALCPGGLCLAGQCMPSTRVRCAVPNHGWTDGCDGLDWLGTYLDLSYFMTDNVINRCLGHREDVGYCPPGNTCFVYLGAGVTLTGTCQ